MNMKKRKLLGFCAVLMLYVGMSGCNEKNDIPVVQQQKFSLTNFANSGCKSNTRAGENDWKETVCYSVLHEGYLYLNHQNAVFNCCPGSLGADVCVEGNLITVGEYESAGECDCVCTYDLSYEIGPLKEGETYTLFIGYKGNESKFAEFTFQNTMSGIWEK